jgi:hypothetical protein
MGEARAIVEQMLEAINAHDMEAAAKTCASDCEFQLPGLPNADVKQWTQSVTPSSMRFLTDDSAHR